MVSRLQTKASQIGNILQSLEKKYESKDKQHSSCISDKSPGTRRQLNLQKFDAISRMRKSESGPPMKKLYLKVDSIPPFNPSKVRKSPSDPTNTELLFPTKETVNAKDTANIEPKTPN